MGELVCARAWPAIKDKPKATQYDDSLFIVFPNPRYLVFDGIMFSRWVVLPLLRLYR
jgi:hypothetical protein